MESNWTTPEIWLRNRLCWGAPSKSELCICPNHALFKLSANTHVLLFCPTFPTAKPGITAASCPLLHSCSRSACSTKTWEASPFPRLQRIFPQSSLLAADWSPYPYPSQVPEARNVFIPRVLGLKLPSGHFPSTSRMPSGHRSRHLLSHTPKYIAQPTHSPAKAKHRDCKAFSQINSSPKSWVTQARNKGKQETKKTIKYPPSPDKHRDAIQQVHKFEERSV